MKKLYIVVIALIVSITTWATTPIDTTRVLFIGNSFTYTFDVPTLVQHLADSAHLPFKFVMYAPGGISVGDTAQGTSAHMNNPIVYDLIRSDNWDFVVLQDNQGRFIYGGGRFPDTNVSKVVRGHLKIRDSVKFYHPCAHMVWFAGWGPKAGYPPYATTADGLIDNIYVDYLALKDTAHEIIAPIGKAWERENDTMHSPDLWGADGTHESLAGAYLTASVIFTTIFRKDTRLVPFDGGLNADTAQKLRTIAFETVTDSIRPTNLAHYLPTITGAPHFLAATPGYLNYDWYLAGTNVKFDSGTSDTSRVNVRGCFYVIATDANGCTSKSQDMCNVWEAVPNVSKNAALQLYPNPTTQNIAFNWEENPRSQIIVYDITGRKWLELKGTHQLNTLQINGFPTGTYYLEVIDQDRVVRAAFQKQN